jgi:hypothetical protein
MILSIIILSSVTAKATSLVLLPEKYTDHNYQNRQMQGWSNRTGRINHNTSNSILNGMLVSRYRAIK